MPSWPANRSDLAMVLTDHGLEPAMVYSRLLNMVEQPGPACGFKHPASGKRGRTATIPAAAFPGNGGISFCKEQVEEL